MQAQIVDFVDFNTAINKEEGDLFIMSIADEKEPDCVLNLAFRPLQFLDIVRTIRRKVQLDEYNEIIRFTEEDT